MADIPVMPILGELNGKRWAVTLLPTLIWK